MLGTHTYEIFYSTRIYLFDRALQLLRTLEAFGTSRKRPFLKKKLKRSSAKVCKLNALESKQEQFLITAACPRSACWCAFRVDSTHHKQRTRGGVHEARSICIPTAHFASLRDFVGTATGSTTIVGAATGPTARVARGRAAYLVEAIDHGRDATVVTAYGTCSVGWCGKNEQQHHTSCGYYHRGPCTRHCCRSCH